MSWLFGASKDETGEVGGEFRKLEGLGIRVWGLGV